MMCLSTTVCNWVSGSRICQCCFNVLFQGLSALHGGALEVLDVRNNALASLHEFSVLAGCPNLTELLVEGGVPGQPALMHACKLFGEGAAPDTLHLAKRSLRLPAGWQRLQLWRESIANQDRP
jgi:hypothetical protein